MNSREIAKLALACALYVALSLALPLLSYAAIQFRFAEAMLLLVFIDKRYTYSLVLGCIIVNLFSPLGAIDVFVGTSATVLVCLIIPKLPSAKLVPIVAALVNGLFVGIELTIVFTETPFFLNFISVFIGEVVCVAFGVLLYEMNKARVRF